MTAFDRFSIKVVAGVGLCGAAIALSPAAVAAPWKSGGAACMYGSAGEVGAPAAAGAGAGAAGAAGAGCAGAPIADMAGAPVAALPVGAPIPAGAPVPGGLPFPAGAPVPAGAPLPVAVPAGAPLIALGGVAGAPIADMAGVAGGKGAPVGVAPTTGPQAGEPLPAGPTG
ncbi:hypothetical protein PT015_19945 [Candidatus Mycobacterium wuenschmannii]|uniref:Beta-xylosidase n=1 Tax=Candidatus Mycobacterium wuenschmannii TaxID=3027808 RepID=A0ABY8VVS7_9MYCO|nr:hypothetical protein [Candidatus Mycobacterium wuenschmannii]WIM87115.1 hypothetical protein PT015_19945 [Candidatus Mycobacterium wuenschmannii]